MKELDSDEKEIRQIVPDEDSQMHLCCSLDCKGNKKFISWVNSCKYVT